MILARTRNIKRINTLLIIIIYKQKEGSKTVNWSVLHEPTIEDMTKAIPYLVLYK